MAAVLPTLGGVVAVVTQWAITGEFDRAELVTALSAVAGSVLAFAGAYIGRPGTVAPTTVTSQPKLAGEKGQVSIEFIVRALLYVLVIVVVLVVLFALLDRL